MNLTDMDLLAQFVLTQSESLLPQEILRGIAAFGSAQNLMQASIEDWRGLGVSEKRAQRLSCERERQGHYQNAFERARKSGIQLVSYFSDAYPTALKNIAAPPILLFYRGHWPDFSQKRLLAVVGTRRGTDYGLQVLRLLLPPLCEAGLGIVSGLAFGIDAWAHEISLAAGGVAVAVLAKGVEQASPRGQQHLFDQVIETGCVISEFAFSAGLEAWHFPRRNRIVSGLCEAVLVVEAPEKSGAIITAHFALEQNRQVYVVPGGILQKQSQGCLQLIQQGAKVVTQAQDILDDYALLATPKVAPLPQMSQLEQKIHAFCATGPKWKDEIFANFAENFSEVSTALTQLELAGCLTVNGAKVCIV